MQIAVVKKKQNVTYSFWPSGPISSRIHQLSVSHNTSLQLDCQLGPNRYGMFWGGADAKNWE